MGVPREALSDVGPVHRLPQHVSTCHCIPLSPDVCILGTPGRQELKRCNVSWAAVESPGGRHNSGHSGKCPPHFFCSLLLYSGNSIHPLLMPFCAQHWLPRASAAARKKRVEHLLRVSLCTPSPPSRVADAGHAKCDFKCKGCNFRIV